MENSKDPAIHAPAHRYDWLDVMKLISIFFVYVVHYEGMGRYGLLFLSLLVPCFFFCSGFTAFRHEKDAVLPFLCSKAQHIVWPYFAFGALSLAVRVLVFALPQGEIIAWIRRFLYGSRAACPVAALWFLPCLFCMAVLYHLLHKLVQNRALLLLLCFALSAAVKLIHEAPVLPWGIDMAGRFLIYYALGDAAHALSAKKPLRAYRLPAKLALLALTLVNGYLLYVHFYFGNGYFASLVGVAQPSYLAVSAEQFLYALSGTWCVAVLAMLLQKLPGAARAGRCTLIFCGVEQVTKTLVPLALSAFGLTVSEAGGPAMLLQAAGMLVVAYYVFARPIASYLPWMTGDFSGGLSPRTMQDKK
ncbi:MAG: acyltransferase family protein [Ruthenibacterium sp.]